MNLRQRLFLPLGAAFLALFLWGLHDMPPWGEYRGPYGDVVNSLAVYERHATDVVTAINFDYRGFDTLGEEFILFTSVTGVTLLLRRQKQDQPRPPRDSAEERTVPPVSDAVRVFGLALVGAMGVFGLYILTHGQLTPGGGFQGGVVLASIPLLVYLVSTYQDLCHIAPHWLVEVGEAVGASGFILLGLAGMLAGAYFLQNVLPFGQTGSAFSAGTIWALSLTTGLEVAAGIILLQIAFLDETLTRRYRGPR
ncbi:MAG TPA: MnhB domain-containing protein [Terriglobales bacterium]|nr:MnhB domain-containing protein [Terriglobales bacterium]